MWLTWCLLVIAPNSLSAVPDHTRHAHRAAISTGDFRYGIGPTRRVDNDPHRPEKPELTPLQRVAGIIVINDTDLKPMQGPFAKVRRSEVEFLLSFSGVP